MCTYYKNSVWGGCSACGRKGYSDEWTSPMEGGLMDTLHMRMEFLSVQYNRKLVSDFESPEISGLLSEVGSGLRHIDPRCPYLGVVDTRKLKKDMEWAYGSLTELWNPYYLNADRYPRWLTLPLCGAYGMIVGLLLMSRGPVVYCFRNADVDKTVHLMLVSSYTPDTLYLPGKLNDAVFFMLKSNEVLNGCGFPETMYMRQYDRFNLDKFVKPKKMILVGMNEKNKKFMNVFRKSDIRGIDLTGAAHVSRIPVFDLLRNPEEVTLPPESFNLKLYGPSSRELDIFGCQFGV